MTVKKNKKGHVVLTINGNQYLELVEFLDVLPEYQPNSQYTPLQRVWNIVLQKLKDRFNMTATLLDDNMKVTLRIEEAVIVSYCFFQIHPKTSLLYGVMMEINRLIQG